MRESVRAAHPRSVLIGEGRVLLAILVVLGLVVAVPGGLQVVSFYLPYAAVGSLLVVRRPHNSIGWLLLVPALMVLVGSLDISGPAEPLIAGTAPFAERILAWLTVLSGLPIFFCFALLAIVFPSGRLPSGNWGRAARVFIALSAVLFLATAIGPSISATLADNTTVEAANPFAVLPPIPWWAGVHAVSYLVLFASDVLAALSIVIRLRRSHGLERQQLRWVVLSLVLLSGSLALTALTGFWFVAVLAFPTLPIAIGIAVLRYRLYEIDLLINRTLLYGSVTVVLVVLFGLANLGLQKLAERVTGQHSDLISAVLGGAFTVAFGPLRRRVRPIVDRLLPSRAELTLLFTDIVGSTEAIVELGDQRWRDLLARYRATVRAELARVGGREVNTAGDAFFATFDRALAGLRCALAIRPAIRLLGIETRTGLHVGEVEMRGEEVSGLAVHTAARVMGEAGAGEILVSDALREALAGQAIDLDDRGRHALKGVPGEWHLWAVDQLRIGSAGPRASNKLEPD